MGRSWWSCCKFMRRRPDPAPHWSWPPRWRRHRKEPACFVGAQTHAILVVAGDGAFALGLLGNGGFALGGLVLPSGTQELDVPCLPPLELSRVFSWFPFCEVAEVPVLVLPKLAHDCFGFWFFNTLLRRLEVGIFVGRVQWARSRAARRLLLLLPTTTSCCCNDAGTSREKH
jgi:hypothetical protein